MPTEEELKKLALQNPGQLQTGATDPLTGKTFQSFAPNIINSEVLTPAPSLAYTTPQSQAAYPVAGLDSSTTSAMQLTPTEEEASGVIKEIKDFQKQLLGQSAYTAEQEKAQGIPDLQKTQTDLSAQLKGLQNEALAIPLQLQNEAVGRGITAGGLAPIQTGKLRENAIKALTVSSLLESSRGNLATAQTLVDRAVAQKFDPIKEEIAVKTANLDLILKSPAYSLEDKKRAQAQKDIQDAKLKKAEKEEADQKAILDTTNKAAANVANFKATPEYPTASLAFQAMQNAKTPLEATLIGAKTGLLSSEKDTGFTLSPGQVRYDAQGNVLGIVPEKPTDITTNDYKNYQLAGGQAGTGKSFNEWLQQKAADTITQENLLSYAQQFASTGKIPTGIPKGSFGEIAQMAKEMPKQEGAIIDVNTGVKPDISDARIDGLAALLDISKKIGDLKSLSNEITTGVVGGTLGKIFGSGDQQRYLDLRTEIIDLLARARTGAALTTQEEKFYSDQLPGRFSKSFFLGANRDVKLDNFESKINQTLDTKLKANSAAVVGFSKVKLGDKEYTVGDTIEVNRVKGRVLPDGSIATDETGFNSDLGRSVNGLDGLKQSIIQQESGGNYKAIGAETPYGKALGKYQIIPQFHFSKIGLSNTEADRQKFLNSPQLQDKLFAAIIDGLDKQYKGDFRKIAAAYYGGGGGAKVVGTPAGNKPQKNAPSINQYVQSVLNRIS